MRRLPSVSTFSARPRKLQRRVIRNRRLTERELAIPPAAEFVFGFIAGIEHPAALSWPRRFIARRAQRTGVFRRPRQPQPFEIVANPSGTFRRTLEIRVVEAQDEGTGVLQRVQPIQRRGAHVADVQASVGLAQIVRRVSSIGQSAVDPLGNTDGASET